MAKTQSAVSTGKKAPRVLPAGTMPPAAKKMAEEPAVEITQEQREGERRQAQQNATQQFVQSQLKTAAAHPPALTAEEQKKADFDAAVAKLAAEMGVQPPPAAKPAKVKVEQHGITRPAAGTETGKVWDAADAISAAQNMHPAAISQVKAHKLTHGMNEHTIKTQYSRWRKFHGVTGRAVLVKSEPVEGQYEGLPQLA